MGSLRSLQYLDAHSCGISELNGVAALTNLTQVLLQRNDVQDLEPLLQNARAGGLGAGDLVDITMNRLSRFAVTNQIPELEAHGVTVIGP